MQISCAECDKPMFGEYHMFEWTPNHWVCSRCLHKLAFEEYTAGEIAEKFGIDCKPVYFLECEADKECKRRAGKAGAIVG